MSLQLRLEKTTMSVKHKSDPGKSDLLGGHDTTEGSDIPFIISIPPNLDNRGNDMSTISTGFKVFPHSFLQSHVWKGAKLKYRAFITELLGRCVWKKMMYMANGHSIELNAGDFACSLRKIADLFNPEGLRGKARDDMFSKNDIEGAIQYFSNHRIIRHVIRHQITVISFIDTEIYELNFSFNQTDNQTEIRQKSDSHLKEPDNQITKKKKKTLKEKIHIPKKEYREKVTLTDEQHKSLLDAHGEEFLNEMLEELSAYKCSNGREYDSDYHLMIGKGWVLKKCKEIKIAPPKTPRGDDICIELMKTFKNEEFYNEARCYIDNVGIAFQRGIKHKQIKFKEFGFWDQFRNMLMEFGIKYEFKH